MNVEKLIALLPMKGHSERVPNKNMKMFCGEPLYHAVMKSLEACDYVSEIVIDTDSEIIAEDAVRNFRKVRILRRPQELQGDFVSMNEIINYDLTRHPEEKHFLQTHSTNPLISSATLNAAIQRYFAALGEGYDSLFGVTKFQSRFYWANGSAINHNPAELIRTQDLPPIYEENSNFYIFSVDSFRAAGNKRIGLHPEMFAVNKLEAIDIDDKEDFILAETLYANRK